MSLPKEAVRLWIKGQEAAQEAIRKERTRYLLELTGQEALGTYSEIWICRNRELPLIPSPVLISMRRAIEKMERQKR